jgi:DNA processing protein
MQFNPMAADFLDDEELGCWLAFDQMNGIGLGAAKVRAICEHLQSAASGWKAGKAVLRYVRALPEETIDRFIANRDAVSPADLLKRVRAEGVVAYPICHPLYPARLREIHDPPCVLYVKGDLVPSDIGATVAIVGTRRPTSYGQRNAKEFARNLGAAGATIISGMAFGVDSLAHWGAIEAGGQTVAVLGCGPDVCYPSSNKPLYKALTEQGRGGVVSEYFPGTKPDSWRFPARNRIIAGMSQALLVIEAGEQSGALITAKMAFEQNREVFALPGRIDSLMSAGTNWLIMKNMAHLTRSFKDILDEMNWAAGHTGSKVPQVVELFGREKELFELLSDEPTHFDVLCERTGMPVGELSASLTMLELAGIVTRHPGDWYTREAQG